MSLWGEKIEGGEKESLCQSCIWNAQLYGYYPVVCVAGDYIKKYYDSVFKCEKYRHFD